MYVESRGKLNINNKSQLSRTLFLKKCVSPTLYDEDTEKIFIIDQEQLQFDKYAGWKLIEIPENLMIICLVMSIFSFMMIYLI